MIGAKNPFRNLVNPGTVSLGLGFCAALFSVKVPGFLMDACKLIGSGAIPLAMLTVGAILFKSLGKAAMGIKALSALTLCRLLLAPAILLVLTKALNNLSLMSKAIIVLQAAMPPPSMSPLITRKYGGDPEFASTGVLYTTLFSLVTVSLFMYLTGA